MPSSGSGGLTYRGTDIVSFIGCVYKKINWRIKLKVNIHCTMYMAHIIDVYNYQKQSVKNIYVLVNEQNLQNSIDTKKQMPGASQG